jgi:hypothetical protein
MIGRATRAAARLAAKTRRKDNCRIATNSLRSGDGIIADSLRLDLQKT